MADFTAMEKAAEALLSSGNKEEAINALYELGLACANENNFQKAEYCKQKIFELDQMALTEIISLGEIIEEKKTGSLDSSCIDMWPELYKGLTNEETNSLFYALKEKTFEPNEVLFQQGMRNANLYFIVSGQVKLIHSMASRQLFLKTLSNGDIAGEDTFFNISTCTTSLVSSSSVKVKYLERTALDAMQEEFPGLEGKLADYAATFEKIPDLLKRKGFDRRGQTRYEIEGVAMIDLLNAAGKSLGKKFKGKLGDISNGGLSFFIKTAKRQTAQLMLGRRIKLTILGHSGNDQEEISQRGRIIGVVYHLFKDYSIHVSFDEQLNSQSLSLLLSHLQED